MSRVVLAVGSAAAVALASCSIETHVDPGNLSLPSDALADAVRELGQTLNDPFGTHPTPVLLGGDAQRVFYATDLTQVDVRFDGPTNDFVIPGFLGPSNVYVHENKERTLVRRLVPSGALYRMVTDGENVAFVRKANVGTDEQRSELVLNDQVLMSLAPSDEAFIAHLALDGRTLVVVVNSLAPDFGARIHAYDVYTANARFVVDAQFVSPLSLRADELLYWTKVETVFRLERLNVVSGSRATLVERSGDPIDVYQSANRVLWSEYVDFEHVRIAALDRAGGAVAVLAETASGRLAGATDSDFVMEASFVGENEYTGRFAVRQYSADGDVKELANFRADRRAGQTMVLGNRVVFVNDDQKIVVVPLAGGERFNFEPY